MSTKPSGSSDTKKSCFVISPIGEEHSDTRRRADQVLKHLIRPAVEFCGYKAVRADEIDKPGLITSQVIQCVANDELVIADLTETNPNVFYELAVRHAIRKPLIQIIQKGERIPFDVGGMRTIHFDHQDLDSVAEAKDSIIAQINELETNPDEIETPISVSIELQKLRQSDDPDDRNYADLLAAISDMRADMQVSGPNLDEMSDVISRRVTNRLLDEGHSRSIFNNKRVRPGMLEEMMMDLGNKVKNLIAIALSASLYKDIAPWVYEIGMEAYRQYVAYPTRKSNATFLKNFIRSARDLGRHRFFRDTAMMDKSLHLALEVSEQLLFAIEHHPDISD